MSKKIIYGDDAKNKIHEGMEKIFRAVGVSLGPRGRSVIFDRHNRKLEHVDDGVSIAKEIELEDGFQNVGALMLKEAALKTNDTMGDGTSTAAVLIYALCSELARLVPSGFNPMALKRGIRKAKDQAIELLRKGAVPISTRNEKLQIAQTASLDNETAELIVDAVEAVGENGMIEVEEGKTAETTLSITEGLEFDSGWVSPHFINDAPKLEVAYRKPLILITDYHLNAFDELVEVLERFSKTDLPLVIMAESFGREVLATLIINKIRGGLKIAAIKNPGYGEKKRERIDDIAIATGAKVVSSDFGHKFKDASVDMAGNADEIRVKKKKTTIIGPLGDRSRARGRLAQIEKLSEQE